MPSSTSRISPITPAAPQPTSSAGRERLVDALERRLRRRQVRARGEHDREVAGAAAERVAGRCGGLRGPESRVRLRRQPAADAYAHAATDLTRRAAMLRRRARRAALRRDLRPDRHRQDRRRRRGGRAAARGARRGPGRGLRRRAAALPRPRGAHGRRDAAGAGAARAPAARRAPGRPDARPRGSSPASRTRRSTASSPRAGARSSSAAPACTCAPRWPSSSSARPPTPAAASTTRARLEAEGAPALHAELAARDPRAAAAIAPDRRPARRPRPRAARPGRAPAVRATSCGRPTRASRPCSSP